MYLCRLTVPAVQAEKRQQDKSRGKKDTQTSYARFDASFELGHRMHGKDAKVSCALEQYSSPAGLFCPCPELDCLGSCFQRLLHTL